MKVTDLSKKELRTLVGEVVEEKLRALFDPDYGLELRDDFAARLETSISSKRRIPFEEVKKRLNLS
jgi:hypothetical protein